MYMLKKFEKVDGILFHHGEANRKNTKYYWKSFMTFMDSVQSIDDVPIYLSQASYCNGKRNNELLKIQDSLIISNENILRGPNTDVLGTEYRHDDCHFNHEGLHKLSDLWERAIIESAEF